jgi:tRNA1(Val) A37 N6-methylase TrmN6
VQFIYSNPKERAELVMVEFIKEGKPGLEILPPLMSEGVKS